MLLVEDDAELRPSLAELLTAAGFIVDEASNGKEALDMLRLSRPDLILLDLMLPVMDGWQFRMEQKREPEFASTPVVVLSADDSPQALAIDANLYIKKPFGFDDLLRGIDDVLGVPDRAKLADRMAHADRLASLGTLAAGVAHEINNPLQTIVGNLRLLEEHVDGESGSAATADLLSDLVRDALEATERIRQIVKDVSVFARVDDSSLAHLDMRAVLDGCITMISGQLPRGARVITDYAAVPLVLASHTRLTQVFVNILLNAAHALAGRRNHGEISLRTHTDGQGQVLVEISDNGSGIPEAVIGRIFEPFFTTKAPGQGTGLGLSICHGIVASLGGEIGVESELGVGTNFRVQLPAANESRVRASAE